MRKLLVATLLVAAAATASYAGTPFPVEPFTFPFRSVAGSNDLLALRYNPSGFGVGNDVELGWFHHYTDSGPGGNNALVLRLKNAAASISWVEDPLFGNRREYFLGAGSPLTPRLFLGTSFRYIKADDSTIQNKHIWTYGLLVTLTPQLSFGARFENPWHTKVGGVKTDGTVVTGLHLVPVSDRLEVAMDWIYPEKEKLDDTKVIWSAAFHAVPGLDLNAFAGTDDRFGVELRILIDRSAAGNQLHWASPNGWQDGTLYVSVLQRDYDHATVPDRGPVRYSQAR